MSMLKDSFLYLNSLLIDFAQPYRYYDRIVEGSENKERNITELSVSDYITKNKNLDDYLGNVYIDGVFQQRPIIKYGPKNVLLGIKISKVTSPPPAPKAYSFNASKVYNTADDYNDYFILNAPRPRDYKQTLKPAKTKTDDEIQQLITSNDIKIIPDPNASTVPLSTVPLPTDNEEEAYEDAPNTPSNVVPPNNIPNNYDQNYPNDQNRQESQNISRFI